MVGTPQGDGKYDHRRSACTALGALEETDTRSSAMAPGRL